MTDLSLVWTAAGAPRSATVTPGGRLRVGRGPAVDLVVDAPGVSRLHALLEADDDRWWIADAGSANGTAVNGVRLAGRAPLAPGDRIALGPVVLAVAAITDRGRPLPDALREHLLTRLAETLDLRRLDPVDLGASALRGRAREALTALLDADSTLAAEAPAARAGLVEDLLDDALGLGPLEPLLADPTITEVMANGPACLYVERGGRLVRVARAFASARALRAAIDRIVAAVGRRIDETQPLVDARLADGSRVHAIIPPLALDGPVLTIRKFAPTLLRPSDLVRLGTLDARMAAFLEACVLARRSLVIAGGTGSGKTTLLNLVASHIPAEERIVTIEDAAELRLPQPHVVRLESRLPNIEGRGAVPIRELVRNALRMRPDRIVVGEVRGGEALDMLQAMNTGHDGSLTTVHANGPRDALARIETLALMGGVDLPHRAVREQVASAVHVVVHQARLRDGRRIVTGISEVVGLEGAVIALQDLFRARPAHDGPRFEATGLVPASAEAFRDAGVPLDTALFRAG
ncbi:MAG TPA: ATPase, T2SS/T4P/T4SS family [Thermodesulfobacteriota bacterium]